MAVKAKAEITISRIIDIDKVTRYYLLQSSTATAPSKPTANPPGGNWTTTEPSYTSGTTNTLYFVDQTLMTNGTYSYSAVSISSSYEAAKEAWNKANNAQSSVDDLDDDINNVESNLRTVISEKSTDIINECEGIILKALETYTSTSDFDEFKRVTENQLKILSDSTTLQIKQTTEELNKINEDLQSKFNTITKYFTFDINGLTIGQVDNPYKVIIDNDRYSMTVNDVEVMWIANGKVYTSEIEVTNVLRLIDYMIDKDNDGNVNCAYIGGDS